LYHQTKNIWDPVVINHKAEENFVEKEDWDEVRDVSDSSAQFMTYKQYPHLINQAILSLHEARQVPSTLYPTHNLHQNERLTDLFQIR
jgi:hypothetical protein